MKRTALIKLIENLKKNNINFETSKILLQRDTTMLEKLSLLEDDMFLKGLKVIKLYKDDNKASIILDMLNNTKYKDYIYELFMYHNSKDFNFIYHGANIINEAKEVFNAKYIYQLLISDNKDYNYLLSGANIINEAKEVFNAKYIYKLLISQVFLDIDIVSKGTKIINMACNPQYANYIYEALIDKESIKKGTSFQVATWINKLNIREIKENNNDYFTARYLNICITYFDKKDLFRKIEEIFIYSDYNYFDKLEKIILESSYEDIDINNLLKEKKTLTKKK